MIYWLSTKSVQNQSPTSVFNINCWANVAEYVSLLCFQASNGYGSYGTGMANRAGGGGDYGAYREADGSMSEDDDY